MKNTPKTETAANSLAGTNWAIRSDVREITRMDELPTEKQLLSACYSYRHDFGLLTQEEQNRISTEALAWWRAIAKEVNQPSIHPMIVSTADSSLTEPFKQTSPIKDLAQAEAFKRTNSGIIGQLVKEAERLKGVVSTDVWINRVGPSFVAGMNDEDEIIVRLEINTGAEHREIST